MKQAGKYFAVRRALAALAAASLLFPGPVQAENKVKLHGYITSRTDRGVVMILDDRLELTAASKIYESAENGGKKLAASDLEPGQLVEAEGVWVARHKFFAEKLTVDLRTSEKEQRGTAYLEDEPLGDGERAFKADGYWLDIGAATKREWNPARCGADDRGAARLSGCHVKYTGIRESNGHIAAQNVELGESAPADAYKLPHDLAVVRGREIGRASCRER